MTVYAPQAETKPARSGDCGCGCGGACGCQSRCCDLECLVRPRFFCGQVLTDADLGATVDWARGRLSLSRYRHGWGVVCGLDVTCTGTGGSGACCPDPQTGPTVYVSPGYAIDCCGNDLVVCDPIAVGLGDACRPPDDPCDPVAPTKQNGTAKPGGAVKRGDDVDCWSSLRDGLFAVTLRLRYHEDLASGQPAMFRGGCSDLGACEYTRVLEKPCVDVEVCPSDCDDDNGWKLWQDEYVTKRAQAIREIDLALKAGFDGVLKYLRRHPPYKFCFLPDLVCCYRDSAMEQSGEWGGPVEIARLSVDDWRRRVYIWLYLDWYLRQFECGCWSCKPDRGVPIARVLMQRVRGRGEDVCRVLMIDGSSPHRRPLHKDPCRPVPRGAVDLAPYFWQTLTYASERLRGEGIRLGLSKAHDHTNVDWLLAIERGGLLWVDPSDVSTLSPVVLKDPFDCERIVGFTTPGFQPK